VPDAEEKRARQTGQEFLRAISPTGIREPSQRNALKKLKHQKLKLQNHPSVSNIPASKGEPLTSDRAMQAIIDHDNDQYSRAHKVYEEMF